MLLAIKTYTLRSLFTFALLAVYFSAYGQNVATYSVYKLERKIGEERCTTRSVAGEQLYDITIETNDRGTPLKLRASLTLSNSQIKYSSAGQTSRFKTESIDTMVSSAGGFAISNNGSIKLKELLVASWIKASKPPLLQSAFNKAGIKLNVLGTEQALIPNKELIVIAIEGVNSVNEILWTDNEGHAVFLATCDTEGDKREVIDNSYISLFKAFNQKSNQYLINAYAVHNQTLGKTYRRMAITGGNVIDVLNDGHIMYNTLVLIEDSRIAYIGKMDASRITKDIKVINASGRFLLPGLWNMHAHLFHPDYLKRELLSGVTTVRDLGNEFDFITRLKAAATSSMLPAPTVHNAGLIDGRSAATLGSMLASGDKEIKDAVKQYYDAGFDQIKVYSSIKPGNLAKIVQEAHGYNMDVVGHVPVGTTATRCVEAGMKSISHIHYFMNALKWKNSTFTIADNRDLLDKMKLRGVVLDPTLSVYALTNDPKLPSYKRLVKFFNDYGLPIVAGTDNEGTIANELQLYTDAGLTPLQAIQTATVVPAKFMKLLAQTGSIDFGKSADILILDKNPLHDIKDLKSVSTVIKGTLLMKMPVSK
ncbi:amidohydrolase family protein [Mucilaginibacter sp. PAMB04168]|uniref:amidohydrolase family protein n=1 Tax=Mucilaginibacter sp. PAMB04168 TaxID=3138567 RepID=UPI0031F62ACF